MISYLQLDKEVHLFSPELSKSFRDRASFYAT